MKKLLAAVFMVLPVVAWPDTTCKAVYDFSYWVMKARQSDVPAHTLLSRLEESRERHKDSQPMLKSREGLLREIVLSAYEKTYYGPSKVAESVALQFANDNYVLCLRHQLVQ